MFRIFKFIAAKLKKPLITALIAMTAMLLGLYISWAIFIPFQYDIVYGEAAIRFGHIKLGVYLIISLLPIFIFPIFWRTSELINVHIYLIIVVLCSLNPISLFLFACAFYRNCL